MPSVAEPFTLGDALPAEIARCRELVKQYEFIGPAGLFGKIFIEDKITQAKQAIRDDDVAGMLRAYYRLRGCQ